MTPILHFWINQLPGLGIGGVLGTALGWATNARREARRMGQRIDRLEEQQ